MPNPRRLAEPQVVIAHRDAERSGRFVAAFGARAVAAESGDEALCRVRDGRVAVLLIGETLSDMDGEALVAALPALEDGGPRVLLETTRIPAAATARRLYFHFSPEVAGGLVLQLVTAATGRAVERFPGQVEELDRSSAGALRRAISIVRRLAESTTLLEVETATALALVDFLRADRAHFWFFDGESGELWRESTVDTTPAGDGSARFAIGGLAAYAARTRRGLSVERAAAHALYARGLDDPDGDGDASILTEPVVDVTGDVHAVFVVVRQAGAEPFCGQDEQAASILARQLAVFLVQFSQQMQADAVLEAPPPRAAAREALFREEAVRALEAGDEDGEVIRISPVWIGWAQSVLFITMAALSFYLVLGTVDEYAAGPAIVRVEGHTEVTATEGGTLEQLTVVSGDPVRAGQVIGRYHSEREASELENFRRKYDEHLIRLLKNPADGGTERLLADLWAQRELAVARLEQRLIRVPHDGVMTDLRARPGDYLGPGDGIASMVRSGDSIQLVALLPGGSRPKLQTGMSMRVRLEEYPGIELEMPVAWIGEEVVGPSEAKRYLGSRVADSVDVSGPIVLAEAHLPDRTFNVDDETYEMFDGMQGVVEVNIETNSILVTLLPVLKEWKWR